MYIHKAITKTKLTTFELLWFRFLSMNTVVAYQRAKVSSLNIVAADTNIQPTTSRYVPTISNTVTVELPKSEIAAI